MLSTLRRRPRTKGGSFLEFALVMPFFLALIMLVWDVGTLVLTRSQVVNAAYASSRQAAQFGAFDTGAQVTARVEKDLLRRNGGPLPNSTVVVIPSSNTGAGTACTSTSTELRTQVVYLMPLPFDFFGLIGTRTGSGGLNTLKVTGNGVARCEVVR